MDRLVSPFVGGNRVTCSASSIPVVNPGTGDTLFNLEVSTAEIVDRAVRGSYALLSTLRYETTNARAARLRLISHTICANAESIAESLSLETGKSRNNAFQEVQSCSNIFDFYASEALRLSGRYFPSLRTGEQAIVSLEPVGVVGAITPFNYPLTLLSIKVAPALAAGCPVVAKPSPETPSATLQLAELCCQAGLEPDLFNVVTGGASVGQMLIDHPLIAKISFTGSFDVGRQVAAAAASGLKRLTLELGGQSPALVAADVNSELVSLTLANQAFENAGQFCYRPARIFVESILYEQFIENLREHALSKVVASADNPEAEIGPLRNKSAYEKVMRHIQDALDHGARLLCGGNRINDQGYENGYFVSPTVLVDVDPSMLVMREETFGPVVAVTSVDCLEHAIPLANSTPYGLAGYVFCSDLDRGWRLADQIEAGSVWVNVVHHTDIQVPFGGRKASGLGREKGREGLFEYLETKTLYLGRETYDFSGV
ncbi:MAG: aldehyde dehydrogenase family protein [Nitrososphaerota archaeon]|jgi:acyl-CoA reductase-like NAD-dependent aldehyde dehydrogenase|nr:aldehyde dehydrogenase family protein [Nitrososphaerota archaeon]